MNTEPKKTALMQFMGLAEQDAGNGDLMFEHPQTGEYMFPEDILETTDAGLFEIIFPALNKLRRMIWDQEVGYEILDESDYIFTRGNSLSIDLDIWGVLEDLLNIIPQLNQES